MDQSAVVKTLAGLLIAALFGLVWSFLGRGVESTISDNPAVTGLQHKIGALETKLIAHELSAAEARAAAQAQRAAIVNNQNKILDALIND